MQLLTFVEVSLKVYRSIYDIFLSLSNSVNIIYLGTIDPYINFNKSQ